MVTDLVILAALLYLFYKGWSRGFFRTLLGPVSLVLACIAAFFYYQETKDLKISLLICVFGPFALNLVVLFGLKLWNKATKDEPPALPLSSKLLGSMFSIVWGSCYLAIMLMTIGLLPVNIPGLKIIQNDVTISKSYALVSSITDNRVPATSFDITRVQDLLNDPESIEQFRATPEFKDLTEDERLMSLFSDEKTAQQIRDKNYTQLMTNPKIQAVLQDPDLLKKFLALNQRMMREGTEKEPEKPKRSPAKWVEVK